MIDPDGGITTYSYDAANRISWLLNPFSEYTTFAYDSLGQRITQQNGNGTWVSYTYDDAGRLTDQVHLKSDNSIFDSWSNEHDSVGNLTATTETNGDIITYTYDSAYQLTREQHVSAHPYDITYTYDAAGNRLTKVDSGTTTTYTCDAASELLTAEDNTGITTFSYDSNGNTYVEDAGGDLTTYTWSIDNMCLGIALPNATLNTFVYDADLKRRQEEDSAGVAKFINDMENVLIETNSGGTTQAAYTLEPQQYGNLLSQRRAGASHFHHFDVIGSTDSVTNAAETKEVHYQSKAFGPTEVLSGSLTANRYLWNARSGYRWEPDTQQYDKKRKRYKPTEGRWISRVHIACVISGFPMSTYLYLRNNPLGQDLLKQRKNFGRSHPEFVSLSLADLQRMETGGTTCKREHLLDKFFTPVTDNIDHTCTRPCTQVHEETHAKDMKECCTRYGKCWFNSSFGHDVCETQWRLWITENLRYLECRALIPDKACLDKLWKDNCCDKLPTKGCCPHIKSRQDEADRMWGHHRCDNPPKTLTPCHFDEDGVPDGEET